MSEGLDLSLPDIAARLRGKIDHDGKGQEVVRCPGPDHSAGDASLTVGLDPNADGGFWVHSFSPKDDDPGRAKDWVRTQLGLPPWKPNGKGNGKAHAQIVAKYQYDDADGNPVLLVNRTKPKGFLQQRRNGSGGWDWGGIPEETKVPFRLPDLIENIALGRTVYVTEGEKAALSLIERGYAATCSPGGAGKWPDHFAQWFKGANVVILPDNDEPGRKHAGKVRENLEGVAASIRVIALPGLKPGGDVWDYLAAGGDPAVIETMPDADLKPPRPASPSVFRADELQTMNLPPPKLVVPGYVAAGLTLLAGKPKVRKSWLALDLCLSVARGGFVLGVKVIEGDVLYCALEDGPRRLQVRLGKIASIGSWPSRLTFWTELERLDRGGEERLREWLSAHPEARLIVIDTFGLARPAPNRDEGPYDYDSRCARQLKALADEFGIAVIAIHHARKMAADDPLEMLSGTNGLTGGADATLILAKNGEGATLYGRSRDLEDVEVAVEFDPETCRWRVLGEAREVRQSDERKAIVTALRDAAEPLSVTDLAAETGMKPANLRQLLVSLVKGPDPLVIKPSRGKYAAAPSHRSQDHKPSDPDAEFQQEQGW